MRRIILSLTLLLAATFAAQGQSYRVRAWFDNDQSTLVMPSFTSSAAPSIFGPDAKKFTFNLDASSLGSGLHALHLQVRDDEGDFTPPITRYFYKEKDKAVRARVWVDDNVSTVIIPSNKLSLFHALPLSGEVRDDGLHALHMALLDTDGSPTRIETRPFYKSAEIARMPYATVTFLIDDELYYQQNHQVVDCGIVLDLDISSLEKGWHDIYAQVTSPTGQSTDYAVEEFRVKKLTARDVFVANIDGTPTTFMITDPVKLTVQVGTGSEPAIGDGCTSYTVPSKVQYEGNVYTVTAIADYAFQQMESLKKFYIYGNVVSIGSYAFEGCSALKFIHLPSSIQRIGTYAFAGCCQLKQIKDDATIPALISDNVFCEDLYGTGHLYVGAAIADRYRSTSPWNYFIINEDVTPMKERTQVTFADVVNAATEASSGTSGETQEPITPNFSNVIIDYIWYSIDETQNNHYNTEQGCFVLESTIDDAQLQYMHELLTSGAAKPQDFQGFMFQVPPGHGKIYPAARADGFRAMMLVICEEGSGNMTMSRLETAQDFERAEQNGISYNVEDYAYVYVYGINTQPASAKARGTNRGYVYDGRLDVYGLTYEPVEEPDGNIPTGFQQHRRFYSDGSNSPTAIYGTDGTQREKTRRGLNIVRKKDGSVKKVVVK